MILVRFIVFIDCVVVTVVCTVIVVVVVVVIVVVGGGSFVAVASCIQITRLEQGFTPDLFSHSFF